MIVSSPLVLEDHVTSSHPQVNNLPNFVRDFLDQGHSTPAPCFLILLGQQMCKDTQFICISKLKATPLILPCDIHSQLVSSQVTGIPLN